MKPDIQINGIEQNPETDTHLYGQLIFTKVTKIIQWGKKQSSTNGARTTWHLYGNKKGMSTITSYYHKSDYKPKCKNQNINLLEKNNINLDTGLGKYFLNRT